MKRLFSVDESFHGPGEALYAWQPRGNLLATAGGNGLVHILDRSGAQLEEIAVGTGGPCVGLDWDRNGEYLAIAFSHSGVVTVYHAANRDRFQLETRFRGLTWLKWSKSGAQLAVGGRKGELFLFHKLSRKQEPIVGKHSKSITCGAWSSDNRLALGSADHKISISRENGDHVDEAEFRGTVSDVQFAKQRADGNAGRGSETTVSAVVGGDSVVLFDAGGQSQLPTELSFSDSYGEIVTHRWFGDGYVLVAFRSGAVVVISTHVSEMNREVARMDVLPSGIDAFCHSPRLGKFAACGDNVIKVYDATADGGWEESESKPVRLPNDCGTVTDMSWTDDGQIMTVSTSRGRVYNFLAQMPIVHDACGPNVAYQSSLREITVVHAVAAAEGMRQDGGAGRLNLSDRIVIGVEIEPSFVSLGPQHVAVGMNNRVWFYGVHGGRASAAEEREYLGTVDAVTMNANYAAVLSEGRVKVHGITQASANRERMLPDRSDDFATCIAAAPSCLVLGTQQGALQFFSLTDWEPLSGVEYRHGREIRAVYPNRTGAHVLFVDAELSGYLYSPVTGAAVEVPHFAKDYTNVMWDAADWGVFAVAEPRSIHTFLYSPSSMTGPRVTHLGPLTIQGNGDMNVDPRPTRVPSDHSPILSYDGIVVAQVASGALGAVVLGTHKPLLMAIPRMSVEQREKAFAASLALSRLDTAWQLALALRHRPAWLALAGKSMEQLRVDVAARVYRQLGDAAMVMALEELATEEDSALLGGHLATLFNDYDQAQSLLLSSSRPFAAIELWCDLLEWNKALKLAERLAPQRVPAICLQLAMHREFRGDTEGATEMYQRALEEISTVREAAVAAGEVSIAPAGLHMGRNGFLFADRGPHGPALRRAREDAVASSGSDGAADSIDAEAAAREAAEAATEAAGAGGGDEETADRARKRAREAAAKAKELASAVAKQAAAEAAAAGPSAVLRPALYQDAAAPVHTHAKLCKAGLARCAVRVGDVRRATVLLREVEDRAVVRECAGILEGLKQSMDAAALYEMGGQPDKAAAIFIHNKAFGRAAPLMGKILAPRLHAQYAKAKEAERDYAEAATAYERAGDHDAVVRLYLNQLDKAEDALAIVRRTQSADGAAMVADYCRKGRNYRGAVEFLLTANRVDEAFDLAKEHEEMSSFSDALGDDGSPAEYKRVAQYYEQSGQRGLAGRFYAKCGSYHKAVKMFLEAGEDMLGEAIEVIGVAKNDVLTTMVIDHVMGDKGDGAKDPRYILKVYMALKNYSSAIKTAIAISRQEQEMGNYKVAHNFLFETCQWMMQEGRRVPQPLARALLLLHSYLMVKKHAKGGNHARAARLLVRVARNISKFPKHQVPILTSTVIECQRARLKQSAYGFASTLMSPDFRASIDAKFKRKIEAIVRKKPSGDEAAEPLTPCPWCNTPVAESVTECESCQNRIPFCIVTGTHMVKDDYTVCPSCNMPGLHSAFVEIVEQDGACPMCAAALTVAQVERMPDPEAHMKKMTGEQEDEEDEDENAAKEA